MELQRRQSAYPPLDKELIEAARMGDRAAFGLLSALMLPRLVRHVVRLTGDVGLAEQLAQETLTKALNDVEDRPGGLQFSAWLYRIASNLVIDHHRRRATRRTYSLDERMDAAYGEDRHVEDDARPELHTHLVATGSQEIARDPAEIVGDAEDQEHLKARLAAVMAALSETHRTLLTRRANGQSYQQIGDALGLPVATVKGELERCRKLARRAFAESGGH